ncbi:hypothetical protein ACLOJK_017172 [Asimina triloba]
MGLSITIFSLLCLLYSAQGLVVLDPKGSRNGSLEWKILTKKNFSSQIQSHPHILLIVTVPWSGESRSLMKDVARQMASKKNKLNHLRFMVLYRNTEKMLADALGATEGITIFCYHQSRAYKYRGRLRAQNILSSAYHLMSLQSEELPLKSLNTPDDLQAFFHSTDKAVLLLEFCGWTSRLLKRSKNDVRESALLMRDASDNESLSAENFNHESGRALPLSGTENPKVAAQSLQSEKLVCEVETGLTGISWFRKFILSNGNASLRVEDKGNDTGISCTLEEFHRFESFFSKFVTIARDFFLPPERQRFGVVSKRSLLSFLGVNEPDTWSVMLQFSGCPNCLRILTEGDDLNAIMMPHPLVKELENDGYDLVPALPASGPSMLLFLDRSAESSKIRRLSKSALKDFRELAIQNQVSYEPMKEQDKTIKIGVQAAQRTKFKDISDPSVVAMVKQSLETGSGEFQDKMTYMIIDERGNVAVDNMAENGQGNSVRDILAYLLQQRNPALRFKGKKISVLAKDVGFQLLSDDFEVKVIDALPAGEGNDQSESFEAQISEQPMTSVVEDSAILNEDLNTIIMDQSESFEPQVSEQPDISMVEDSAISNEDLNGMTTFEHREQQELVRVENSLKCSQEAMAESEEHTTLVDAKSAHEIENGVYDIIEDMSISNDHGWKEKDVELSIPVTEGKQQFNLEKDSHLAHYDEEHICKDHSQHAGNDLNDTSLDAVEQNCGDDCLGTSIVGNTANEGSWENLDKLEKHPVEPLEPQGFRGFFFFSDGGYRLLRMLTAAEKIPSVVIIDPVLQRHYVFPEKKEVNHSSIVHFVDSFLNGSLHPFQQSEHFPVGARETLQPPFVNLDFHEAESIPRVTARLFSELVLGFDHCDGGYTVSCMDSQIVSPAWKKDVLVLFSNSWCGFCLRMELVVREVYRAFKGYENLLKGESKSKGSTSIQDSVDDATVNEVPLLFLMDCTLNDCSTLLKSIGQRELYPALLLFPAEKKHAVSYQGDISVANIIEFIASHGTNSHHLSGKQGIVWTKTQKSYGDTDGHNDRSSGSISKTAVDKGGYHEVLLNSPGKPADKHHSIGLHTSDAMQDGAQHIGVGSVLSATDKLLNAHPFDKSKILIVKADQREGFLGLIINKRVKWDVLPDLVELEPLKQARLSIGGPVVAPGMPLVSFTRSANEPGYVEIFPGFYYGDQLATKEVIEEIQARNRSAIDYWFVVGYSVWGWDQLFAEIAEGSWHVHYYRVDQIYWPEA